MKGQVRIVLGEKELRELFAGRSVGNLQVRVALADIGWDRMLAALSDAANGSLPTSAVEYVCGKCGNGEGLIGISPCRNCGSNSIETKFHD